MHILTKESIDTIFDGVTDQSEEAYLNFRRNLLYIAKYLREGGILSDDLRMLHVVNFITRKKRGTRSIDADSAADVIVGLAELAQSL